MRHNRRRRFEPDVGFQIPAADLVTDPPTVTQRLRAELQEFSDLVDLALALQNTLADRAVRLVEGLGEMMRAGESDPELEAQIIPIVQNIPLIQNLAKKSPLHSVPVVSIYTDPYSKTETGPETARNCAKLTPYNLAEYLEGRGFDDAALFIERHGLRIVLRATREALKRNQGEIGNFGAYIQGVVAKMSAAQPPRPQGPARYLGGKLGHLVQH